MIRCLWVRFLHKLAQWAPGGSSLRPWLHRRRGVDIRGRVWISQQVFIDDLHPENVTIHDNVTIGLRTSIVTHLYWGPRRSDEEGAGKVVIERDVFIGPHCVILPDVHIGEGAVIKAGTVVSRNVPPRVLWGHPQAEALARVMVPLVPGQSYKGFAAGLRPLR